MLSPASAYDLPEALNLTLFGERIEDEHYAALPDPATNPRPDTYLHAVLITDFGAPTEYAMHHTCYDGSYHITFDRWSAATGYVP